MGYDKNNLENLGEWQYLAGQLLEQKKVLIEDMQRAVLENQIQVAASIVGKIQMIEELLDLNTWFPNNKNKEGV